MRLKTKIKTHISIKTSGFQYLEILFLNIKNNNNN